MKTYLLITTVFWSLTLPIFAQEKEVEKTVILDSIVIEGEAFKEVTHVATNYIKSGEIKVSNPRDVGDYLRSIPNVSGIRKGGSAIDPVVRGFKYSQLNVILNNGVKMENGCPNRMDPVSSHIEAEDINNIEIIKGPYALRYGPSFGGVINLVAPFPEPREQFEIHANGMYGYESNWKGNKFHGTIYGGGKKVFFITSAGYRKYGDYQSGSLNGEDTVFNSSFKKYNYLAKLGYRLKADQKIILSFDGVHGRDVMYPALPMDEKHDNTYFLSLDYSAEKLSPTLGDLDIKVYRSMVDHVMDNSHRANYSTMQMVADVDAINTGGNATFNFQLPTQQLVAGLDLEHIEKDGKRTGTMSMMGTTSTKITNLWKEARITNVGIFAEYKKGFPRYELYLSARGDLNDATSGDTLKVLNNGVAYFDDVNSTYFNFSASVGLTRKINSWMDVSLALARGTRSPNMLERYIKLLPVGYDSYDYLGNPQLKPETNNEVDLTFRVNREEMGSLYFNLFYSHVENYISANLLPGSVITPQTPGVLGVKQFDNVDYAIHKGFEFGYRSSEKYRLGGRLVAAYTYGEIPEVTKYVISEGQVVDSEVIEQDALPEIPPFETTIDVHYKLLEERLVPRISLRVVAPQHHISEAFYESYTPGFWVMNFSAAYKVSNHVNMNLGISNIFDRSYYEHLNRRIIGSNYNLYESGRVLFATLSVSI